MHYNFYLDWNIYLFFNKAVVTYLNSKKQKYLKVAFFMAIDTGIHNIPAGIALGSLLNVSYTIIY